MLDDQSVPDVYSAKRGNFVSNVVRETKSFLDALERLGALSREYNRTLYGKEITEDDLVGDNGHITPQALKDALEQYEFIEALLDNDGWVKFYNMLP